MIVWNAMIAATNWDNVTAISTAITAGVAVIAIIANTYYQRRTIQIDTLMKMDERFSSADMAKLRAEAARKLRDKINPNPELTSLLDFFWRQAIFVESGTLDFEDSWQEYEYWITRYWIASKEHIERIRKKDHQMWWKLQKLVDRLLEYRQSEGYPDIDDNMMSEFLNDEIQGW